MAFPLKAVELFPSATRTTTAISNEFTASSPSARFFLVVTASGGTGAALSCYLEQQDPVSGAWVQIGESDQIGAGLNGTPVSYATDYPKPLGVFLAESFPLLGTFRVRAQITGTSPSATFSLSVLLAE